jgi:hypothetical protein
LGEEASRVDRWAGPVKPTHKEDAVQLALSAKEKGRSVGYGLDVRYGFFRTICR